MQRSASNGAKAKPEKSLKRTHQHYLSGRESWLSGPAHSLLLQSYLSEYVDQFSDPVLLW